MKNPRVSRYRMECPAKVNFYLAVHGNRPDGFHELTSVAVPVSLYDVLELEWSGGGGITEFSCSVKDIPDDATNLALLAYYRMKEAYNLPGSMKIRLVKRIPYGAGLGGGSSDGAGMIRALCDMFEIPLTEERARKITEELGSDCPMFLHPGPVVFRGRGEVIKPCLDTVAKRLQSRDLLLFKPSFSISTTEAYRRMADSGKFYTSMQKAQVDLEQMNHAGPIPYLNDFEKVLATWVPSLPALLSSLRAGGYDARLSGSGSAGFVCLDEPERDLKFLHKTLKKAWGSQLWTAQVRVH